MNYTSPSGTLYNGFIYIWIDKKEKMYYLGSHVGSIDDGYKFSGTGIKNAYRQRPLDFKRYIVSYHLFENVDDLRLIEQDFLIKCNAKDNLKFYNRINYVSGGFFGYSIEKRKLDLDENGLNDFQKAGLKQIKKRKLDIDENGLNSIQRASLKMSKTRHLDGSFKTSKVQEYKTKYANGSMIEIKKKLSDSIMGRKAINNGVIQKMIREEEFIDYDSSWKYGILSKNINKNTSRNKKGIIKNNKQKYIKKEDLDKYLKEGWVIGTLPKSTGKICVTNGIINKVLKEENVEEYLLKGWKIGMFKNKIERIAINNGTNKKYILQKDLEEYIKLGWLKGGLPTTKDLITINDGKNMKCVKKENLDEFVNNGWNIGGLNTRPGGYKKNK